MSELTTRPRRVGRILAAALAAGAFATGVAVATAPADAATVTNPSCPLPASVVWQNTGNYVGTLYGGIPIIYVVESTWQTTYNGVHYVGSTLAIGRRVPPPPPNQVTPGQGGIRSASCVAQ